MFDIVKVEEPVGFTEFEEKDEFAPAGRPLKDRATASLYPPVSPTLIVYVPFAGGHTSAVNDVADNV